MATLSEKEIQNLALIIEDNGKVLLQCDEYKVSLRIGNLVRYRPARTVEVVMVYVDGRINVKWCNYDCPQSKFFMPSIVDGNKTLYQPHFCTARAALEHIDAASDSVSIVKALTKRECIDMAAV